MSELFQFPSMNEETNGAAQIRRLAFKKAARQENRNIEFSDLIQKHGGLPKPDELILFKSNGASDTGSLFAEMLKVCGKLDTLYLSTWIISRENIDLITNAIDKGNLKKCVFACSKRLKELKKSNYAYLIDEFQKRPDSCKVKILNNHAKTFSVNDFSGNFYTANGSGNWTKNPRIEVYHIFNNEEIYRFNQNWITELVK